jgi:23S rRNA (uracil1939-C5)-methyltransferase
LINDGLITVKKHQKITIPKRASRARNLESTKWHGTIERLAWGGIGISHTENGKIILLSAPFAMFPGEVVKAKVYDKTQYCEGQVTDWIHKDPKRCKAACSVANICGGCSLWESGNWASDLKREMVKDLLSRQLPNVTSWHWVSAPKEAKRHRIQLHWNGNELGFYRRNSHSVVPIQTCPAATDQISQAIVRLQEAIENHIISPKVQRWELTTGTPANTVYASIDDGRTWQLEPDGWHSCDCPVNHNFDTISLQHKIGDFFQACPSWAWQAFKDIFNSWNFPNGTLYDLYGGVGLFSALLRNKFKKYVLVETSVSAIQHANRNLATLNLDFHCITADVDEWVSPSMGSVDDLILLDPPRTGLTKELCIKLQTSNANTMVLIGCDGAAFCRDVKRLEPTWHIKHLVIVDLFPMTHNVECVAILQKSSND